MKFASWSHEINQYVDQYVVDITTFYIKNRSNKKNEQQSGTLHHMS